MRVLRPRHVATGLLLAAFVGLPWFVVWSRRPSAGRIEEKRELLVGSVTTAARIPLEVHIMIGDVFQPRRTLRDVGFDLVAVTCFFDPIEVDGKTVLLTNPLLNSALLNSAGSEEELRQFVSNLLVALDQSRDVVACFQNSERPACEGDQIVPYIWPVYHRSPMLCIHGVKYLAALPVFDPSAVMGNLSADEARHRLRANTLAAVRRLSSVAAEQLDTTVRSFGLAAVASTSHRGDSDYFLTYSEGFRTILAALAQSRPPSSLDRIYLVAFDKLEGSFRADAIRGLQDATDLLTVKAITTAGPASFLGGLSWALLFVLAILNYQQVRTILATRNRWNLIRTIAPVTSAGAGISWGGAVAIARSTALNYWAGLWWYSVAAFLCFLGTLWLSKRIRVG